MSSRYWLGFGLALCATVTTATFLGTRVVLDELRSADSGREEWIRRLEEKLSTLERRDGAFDRRLQALAAARSVAPRVAAAAPEPDVTSPVAEASHASPLVGFPGAVIDDPRLLSDAERLFIERFPPSEKAILVRGTDGRLGYLRISSKRDGERTDTVLDESNFGLVEELSTAIVDLDGAIQQAMTDLAAAGAGSECATMAEAANLGRELGGYYVLPTADRFRVFSALEVERDRRVALASARLDGIKSDFGEFTAYVMNWVQPALETP
jgi:hypothetical protein